MIYAIESEVRKRGLATVVLYSHNDDKKNPICQKNQKSDESFLNWISRGTCFQKTGLFQEKGQNLYLVSGRAYQIVAALKNCGYDAECRPNFYFDDPELGNGIRLLLETKPRQISFPVQDLRYNPIEAIEWNIAQFEAFRKAHPRAREVALVTLADTSYIRVALIEDALKRRKELFLTAKNPGNIALKHFEIYGTTFTTKKGR